ncbi:MAG: PH domain-containing protein [Firmicutes bacterium]|nr:PH domain-containing protein [Bacillota bacterium]
MKYKTKKAYGGWLGLIGVVVIFGFSLWGINYALDATDRTLKIMLYIPTYIFLAAYIYFVFGAFNLGYRIDDNALLIKWGFMKKKFKWDEFEEITAIQGQANFFPYLGVSWWGYMVGMYSAKGLGTVRMFATHAQEGFIWLKTKQGVFGITPADPGMVQVLLEKTGQALKTIDMDRMSPEEKGEGIQDDRTFKLYYRLNQIFVVGYAAYLAIFFPGSGAPKFVILLLVLAIALFFFNASNAKRIYQFSAAGAHMTLIISLLVTGMFIILSLFGITLK